MFLKRVELTNVRCIRSMSLPLVTPEGGARRWTMLLGENGVGKSTLMRAVGLVLAGSAALPELIGDPESWIRAGENECAIDADFDMPDGSPRHVRLSVRRGDSLKQLYDTNREGLDLLDRAVDEDASSFPVIGYGASRRLSSTKLSTQPVASRFRHPRANNVATLFAPDAMLNPLETWALDLHYRLEDAGLRIVEAALAKLLPGIRFKGIDRERRDLLFETVDGEVPLTYLSDGYQHMAAWCGDLLFRLTGASTGETDPLSVRGVLFVDEIELHLHPVWQRHLRDFLTEVFPNFQFVLTTHSVLTAQQAGEGELFVMRRPTPDAAPVLAPSPIEPRTMMVHQLLLSPLFGLGTIDSLAVETMKLEYRRLAALPDRDADDEERLSQLTSALQDLPDWSVLREGGAEQHQLLRDIKARLDEQPPSRRGRRRR